MPSGLCEVCDKVFDRYDYEEHVCRDECDDCGVNLLDEPCICEPDEEGGTAP